jgi:ABC-type multidrug transport system fused ATPase/permease subunit
VFGVGTLVAFIALVSQLYGPLSTVSSVPLEILAALVSFNRVFEILDLEPLITERERGELHHHHHLQRQRRISKQIGTNA